MKPGLLYFVYVEKDFHIVESKSSAEKGEAKTKTTVSQCTFGQTVIHISYSKSDTNVKKYSANDLFLASFFISSSSQALQTYICSLLQGIDLTSIDRLNSFLMF